MSWRAVVAVALLIAGGLLELIAVLGLCVMRNVYDRLHYVGLAGFGGFLIARRGAGARVVLADRRQGAARRRRAVLAGPVLVQTTVRSLLIREFGDWRAKTREVSEPVTVLQIAALTAVALLGGGVVAATDPLRQTLVLSIYGLALTMMFFVFQAPDVALSEIVVSTVGLPVMILLALRKVHQQERERDEEQDP